MIKRLSELWRYRELIWTLVIRDLKVRYKNSMLGFMWSLLNPLLLMLVFTVVFTVMLPSLETPRFPVFVLSALLPWNFFSSSVLAGVQSITGSGHLIKKVYFPREILPISSVLASFVNFLLALPVLFLLMAVMGVPFSPVLLYLPVIMAVQIIFTTGIVLILAAANVFYRDVGVIMEVVMQAWFFMTPVFYSVDLLPEWATVGALALPVRRLLYILNPMASIVASYRSVLYGFTNGSPPAAPAWDFFTRTLLTALVILVIGYWYFSKQSHRFGEEV